MSNPVPDGALLTYTGTWPPGTYAGFADYTGNVFADLANAGLPIKGVSGGFSAINSVLGNTFTIQLTLQVQNGLGFGDVNDVISIVRGFVYQEAGAFPLADSVPYVQTPGGAQTATGQPGQTTPKNTAHACGDPSWGFLDDPGQWVSCLTTKGLSSLGLVFIGLALALVLLFTARKENPL